MVDCSVVGLIDTMMMGEFVNERTCDSMRRLKWLRCFEHEGRNESIEIRKQNEAKVIVHFMT